MVTVLCRAFSGILAAVLITHPLRAQAWEVTELPRDPITDARQAKAVMRSASGLQSFLSVICDGEDRTLLLLLHPNGVLTPSSRSATLYWGTIKVRFDKRPAMTFKTVISDDLAATGLDDPTTLKILPTLMKTRELWVVLPVNHLDERIQFKLPENTRKAIAPVLKLCGYNNPSPKAGGN